MPAMPTPDGDSAKTASTTEVPFGPEDSMLVLCLSLVIVLCDQLTKFWVMRFLPDEGIAVVSGWFHFRRVHNTGAAWGVFEGFSDGLILLSIVMLALIIVFRRSFLLDRVVHKLAMGAMIGGIIGNLIDRVRLGYVVDFLDFYRGDSHFPAFNIADSAICVGVFLYIIVQFLPVRAKPSPVGEPRGGGGGV